MSEPDKKSQPNAEPPEPSPQQKLARAPGGEGSLPGAGGAAGNEPAGGGAAAANLARSAQAAADLYQRGLTGGAALPPADNSLLAQVLGYVRPEKESDKALQRGEPPRGEGPWVHDHATETLSEFGRWSRTTIPPPDKDWQ